MMNAIFEFPIGSETLTAEEIATITGCQRRTDQVEWLAQNRWAYHKNKAGDPIVGRMYARLRMAGIAIEPTMPMSASPDFSKAR